MKRATLVFPRKQGRVILAPKKLKIGVGLLNGYGGKEETEDEGDMKKCAIREIFTESSGVRTSVYALDLVAIIDFYKAGEHIFECHVFFCNDWIGQFRETEEMGPPQEFFETHLPLSMMMVGDRFWIERIFRGERIRAKVYYNANNTEILNFESEPLA